LLEIGNIQQKEPTVRLLSNKLDKIGLEITKGLFCGAHSCIVQWQWLQWQWKGKSQEAKSSTTKLGNPKKKIAQSHHFPELL